MLTKAWLEERGLTLDDVQIIKRLVVGMCIRSCILMPHASIPLPQRVPDDLCTACRPSAGGTFDFYVRVKEKYYGVLLQLGSLYIQTTKNSHKVPPHCTVCANFNKHLQRGALATDSAGFYFLRIALHA